MLRRACTNIALILNKEYWPHSYLEIIYANKSSADNGNTDRKVGNAKSLV